MKALWWDATWFGSALLAIALTQGIPDWLIGWMRSVIGANAVVCSELVLFVALGLVVGGLLTVFADFWDNPVALWIVFVALSLCLGILAALSVQFADPSINSVQRLVAGAAPNAGLYAAVLLGRLLRYLDAH